jgi:hypothetical protein
MDQNKKLTRADIERRIAFLEDRFMKPPSAFESFRRAAVTLGFLHPSRLPEEPSTIERVMGITELIRLQTIIFILGRQKQDG